MNLHGYSAFGAGPIPGGSFSLPEAETFGEVGANTDLRKFILGLEFNFIPNADVRLSNGQKVGTLATSNIALSIGYTIGNGKNSK